MKSKPVPELKPWEASVATWAQLACPTSAEFRGKSAISSARMVWMSWISWVLE